MKIYLPEDNHDEMVPIPHNLEWAKNDITIIEKADEHAIKIGWNVFKRLNLAKIISKHAESNALLISRKIKIPNFLSSRVFCILLTITEIASIDFCGIHKMLFKKR